jgi:hypothetical protein
MKKSAATLRTFALAVLATAQLTIAAPAYAHPLPPRRARAVVVNCQTYYMDQIRPPYIWNGTYSNTKTPAACRGTR